MMRKAILAQMRKGEGSMEEIMMVMLSGVILSVALLMLIVVFQPTISQFKISKSTITAVNVGSSTNVSGI